MLCSTSSSLGNLYTGYDMLQAEHLKYGGPALRAWILQICNSIIIQEHVPDCFKIGIIIPIYKRGGRDPLDVNNYQGITLTSVLSKILESLILARLRCHLSEKGIPHLNQTRLRCHLSEKGIPHLNQTRLRCHLSEKRIPHLNQTCLRCHLSEKGIPHLNQTAYKKRVPWAEAILATLEVVSQHAQHNEKMYMCFFDLQKAFDSVEYPVLFKHSNDCSMLE